MGDDIKNIDWKATAKNNELFVKEYQEERQTSFYLCLDISSSTMFSSQEFSKHEMALNVLTALIFSILKTNNKLSLLLFSDKIEKYLPPRSGSIHAHKILATLAKHEPRNKKTNITEAIKFMRSKRRGFVFLFSDFLFPLKHLEVFKTLNEKHKIFAFHLQDKLEREIPSLGLLELEDSETGKTMLVDTSSRYFSKNYLEEQKKRLKAIEKTLLKFKIKKLTLLNDEDYLKKVFLFFNYHA